MDNPDPPKRSFRQWAQGLKNNVKKGFEKLGCSTPTSRAPTPMSGRRVEEGTVRPSAEGVDTTQVAAPGSPLLSNPEHQISNALEDLTTTAPLPIHAQPSMDCIPGDLQQSMYSSGVPHSSNSPLYVLTPTNREGTSPDNQVQVLAGLSTDSACVEATPTPHTSSPTSADSTGYPTVVPYGTSTSTSEGLPINTALNSAAIPTKELSTVKDAVKVTLNFTQTLLKRLPNIVDGNPVKMALALAKTIVEIKDAVKDNMDAVEERIASTGAQLAIVGDPEIKNWDANDKESMWLEQFRSTLNGELTRLHELSEEWVIRKIADHEDEKTRIAAIFERVNEARMQFELYTNIRILSAVTGMERAIMASWFTQDLLVLCRLYPLKWTLPNNLMPSHKADHKYYIEGEQREVLRREACTPGTRVGVLGDVVAWANDTSPESEDIFWLFGPAGSGKTTIAYTIARRFESTFDSNDTITLGGNFLCSRQFEETRRQACIIRTLAYQLARKCKGFADALSRIKNFDAVHQDVRTQLHDLLITPWRHYLSTLSKDSSNTTRFLFLIDAIDEIEQQGGSAFLRDLLTAINNHHLPGIKFLVTSRSDPDIVSRIEKFERKQFVRLQDVEEEEVRRDITTYLEASLPHFKGCKEMDSIQAFSGDLFIVAATIVRHLTLKRILPSEQTALLQRLFSQGAPHTSSTKATHLLDSLYTQILTEAFDQFPEEFFEEKLSILHTFICTVERTSTSIVVNLLNIAEDSDHSHPSSAPTNPADAVLSCLHAVLYINNNTSVTHGTPLSDPMNFAFQ